MTTTPLDPQTGPRPGAPSTEAEETYRAGNGRGTLAARAYDLLDECGHAVEPDVLVAHCFGVAPRRNPEFWRGQLARVLADDETFVQDEAGAWSLRSWLQADAAFSSTHYVVIDVETTGLGARTHRIIEVAAVRCRGAQVVETFSSLVNPRRRISNFIREFTGITPDMLVDAPETAEVLPLLLEFVGADPLVGHNVAFDLGFLHAELARLDAGLTLTNAALDTGHLATRLLPTSVRKPSLDRLCAALGLTPGRRHRAEDDALLTARAFWGLAERARADGGTVAFTGLRRLAVPPRGAGTSVNAALRGQRGTGRTLLDPALRRDVPQKPGVYLMKDAAGEVIYVGKAKRLRDRISSYYSHPLGYTRKMDGLLESVRALETIVVGSELEALLLESRLIKRYLPRFNVQQRYYAHYPFIKVDLASPYPRIFACREIAADGARYFGPFRSMRAVRTTIDLVHRMFPVRTCTRALKLLPPPAPRRPRRAGPAAPVARHRQGAGPCLRYQIGRCLGPCHGGVTPEQYGAAIQEVLAFLGGGRKGMLERIRMQMFEAAERQDYERAARLRDLFEEARKVLGAQEMLDGAVERHNLIILMPSSEAGAVEIFGIRHARMHAQLRLVVCGPDGQMPNTAEEATNTTVHAFLRDLHAAPPLPEAIGQEEVDQITIITRWIFHHSDDRTYLTLPAEPDAQTVAEVLESARALLRRTASAGDAEWEDADDPE